MRGPPDQNVRRNCSRMERCASMPDYRDDDFVNVETHHERSDVNVRALLWTVVIFAVFAVLTHLLLWGMFKQFARHARRDVRPPMTAIARPAGADVPQEPRLQPFPTAERPPNRGTAQSPLVQSELGR